MGVVLISLRKRNFIAHYPRNSEIKRFHNGNRTPNSACYQCSEQSFYARLNISSLVLSRINPDMIIGFDGMKLGVEMRCPRHSEDSGSKNNHPARNR